MNGAGIGMISCPHAAASSLMLIQNHNKANPSKMDKPVAMGSSIKFAG